MQAFFSDEMTQPLEWFGLAHILLTLGFIVTVIALWIFAPKLRGSKVELWARFFLIGLVILFEWRVFESRMLTGSLFRMPLCAVSLYGLTFAIAFRKEWAYKIVYFYAFGSLLSFVFFDTPWGLDRWNGWTFFGAHATIAWLAVYGYRVLGYTPTKKDLGHSMIFLAIYAFIAGYAYLRFGGADELFLFNPPVDFLMFFKDIHPVVYLLVFSLMAAFLMFVMYLPIYFSEKRKAQ
ncbi:MAG: YwaF family protein [Candidatus Izemoplasmatales bacterium]|nr:YwaF family protein [Candidatus Izemoplasmatales bacterium]